MKRKLCHIAMKKPQGPSAAIGDGRSELMTFCRLALGGPSRTAGLGPCFWETACGAEVSIHGNRFG